MAKRRLKKPAFTLLEILVALSMLMLILGSVYGTYMATIESLAHSKPKSVLQQRARLFLQRITSEIRCCYTGYQNKPSQVSLNLRTRKKEVLKQENPSLFVGKEVAPGQTFLQFVTSAATSRRDRDIRGLAIVEYRLDESANTLLQRKRRYIDRFEDDNNYDWLVVSENVQTITVEYFDGKKWLEEWESNDMKGLLPRAVRISVILQDDDVRPMSFVSTAHLVCRGSRHVTVQKTTVDRKYLSSDQIGTPSNDSRITKK